MGGAVAGWCLEKIAEFPDERCCDRLWTDSYAIDLQRRTSPKSPKTKREQIDAGL